MIELDPKQNNKSYGDHNCVRKRMHEYESKFQNYQKLSNFERVRIESENIKQKLRQTAGLYQLRRRPCRQRKDPMKEIVDEREKKRKKTMGTHVHRTL